MRKYLYAREMLLTISSANLTRLLCQWPCCKNSASFSFVGTEALHEHYRSVHDTHDYSWSCLLPCQSIPSHSGAGIAPLVQRIQSDGTATSLRSGQSLSSGVPSTRDVAELSFILKCSERNIYSQIMLFNVTQCMGVNLQYRHLPRIATPTKRILDQCTGNLLPWIAGHLLPAPPMGRCSQNHHPSLP